MRGETKVPRGWKAFFLGVLSFFLLFIGGALVENVGDAVGTVLAFVLLAAYFFICQFRLSRGNPNALRKDWPVMAALDAVPLMMVLIMALVEKWPVILSQGLGILLSCCGGTFAGAVAASGAARRTGVEPQ
jgi:hypothetical protein